jgi:hypothetical protein
MSDEEAIGAVGPDRRTFVRRLVMGAVFAAPVVSSFTMGGVQAVFGAEDNVRSTTMLTDSNTTPPEAPEHYPTDVDCFPVLVSGVDVTVADGNNSLHLVVPAGALPVDTSICIFRADLTSLSAIVPEGQTPVSGYAVVWNIPGGGHPDATSAITLTVTDPTVGGGDKIFVINGNTAVGFGTASSGTWIVTFTTDPSYVVTHAAAAAAVSGTPAVTG